MLEEVVSVELAGQTGLGCDDARQPQEYRRLSAVHAHHENSTDGTRRSHSRRAASDCRGPSVQQATPSHLTLLPVFPSRPDPTDHGSEVLSRQVTKDRVFVFFEVAMESIC